MAITYVGGKGNGTAGQGGGSIDLTTGLTGGSGGAPLEGDLVLVTVSVGTAARQPTISISTPTGYTALTAQRTTSTTYDTNVQTCWKFMGSTPDTSVTIPASGNNQDGIAYEIQVFRGVDPASFPQVTPTYATDQATDNLPNPASITPTMAGSWIVVCGGGAAAAGGTYAASYLTNFLTHNGPDTNDANAGCGYYTGWTSGAYDPAKFTGGSANAANSWGCTTIVLRPIRYNGFLTTSPPARHGDATTALVANLSNANKFTLGGSGNQELTEIGAWVSADAATTGAFRLAVFTHDAVNDNPDVMVANSESAELTHNTTTVTKKSHTYGTKPVLTGGSTYWIGIIAADANLNADLRSLGGTLHVYTSASTYPAWPTATQWDSAAADFPNEDFGLYAVYQAGGVDQTVGVGALSGAGTLNSVSVGLGVGVAVGLLQASGVLHATLQSCGATISLNFLQGTATIHTPSLSLGATLALGILSGSSTIRSVNVETGNPITVQVGLLSAAGALSSPTVTLGITVGVGLLQGTATIRAVSLSTGVNLALGLLSAIGSVKAVTVVTPDTTVVLGYLSAVASLKAATAFLPVNVSVVVGLLSASGMLYILDVQTVDNVIPEAWVKRSIVIDVGSPAFGAITEVGEEGAYTEVGVDGALTSPDFTDPWAKVEKAVMNWIKRSLVTDIGGEVFGAVTEVGVEGAVTDTGQFGAEAGVDFDDPWTKVQKRAN